tara:strand:- start:480 stop:890 length:411 start_codon:yes stop_codon:yes gene_type:complete
VTDRTDGIEIRQFGPADIADERGFMTERAVMRARSGVIDRHHAKMMHAFAAGIEKFPVHGGLVVVLVDEFNLQRATVAERECYIDVCRRTTVDLVAQRTVLEQKKRPDFQGFGPVFQGRVQIFHDVGELPHGIQRL